MNRSPQFIPPHPLNTAVLFLVFNRLDTTKQVFEAIRTAKPPRLYIAADGARENKEGEAEKVQAVRDFILQNIDWECDVKTLFRDKNFGCKYAVSGAITWFFDNEEQGIILEDDCLPSQSFFWFCEDLLVKYKYDLRVWHIGGTNPIDLNESSDEYYYSNYNRIWGWASWKRAWSAYDVEIADWPEIKENNLLDSVLEAEDIETYNKLFDSVFNGNINTWDYQWFLIRLLHGKAIIPKVNLVSNIGFGSDATHTFDVEHRLSKLARGEAKFPLVSPKYFIIDQKRDSAWRCFSNEKLSIFERFKRAITKLG
ncbi:TPA: hypothetical protein ACVU00_000888 [Vibrio cholerae]|uniref:hypothetical protein n=1 Tax=Vibrio cholerae TaxID=666 RepID=UPI00204963CD|nr:putative monosaccharide biosynthesis protein [Vibrio cholerae]GHZ48443.1 hypothetical protein VCSRO125_2355 [Vibrio cholerae]